MMRILGNRVLVALPPKEQETKTESGLVLVRDPDRKQQTRGVVVALGERRGVVQLDDVRAEVAGFFNDSIATAGPKEYLEPAYARDDLDHLLMKMAPAPFDVQVGDVVLFPASAGEVLRVGELDHVLLHESEILCVLESVHKETAA
jgi:co-chaperonin GroES (HSP10)